MKSKSCRHVLFALVMAGFLCALSVQAVENMRFQGTIIERAPCVINGGKQIEVNFGERVGVNKVDGVNYRQTVDYQLQCEAGASTPGLGLTLTGPQSTFDTAALQTSQTGLGIRMTLDGKAYPIASRVPIKADSPPVLQAVPVKAPNVQLTEGAFEVLATLLADYQ